MYLLKCITFAHGHFTNKVSTTSNCAIYVDIHAHTIFLSGVPEFTLKLYFILNL